MSHIIWVVYYLETESSGHRQGCLPLSALTLDMACRLHGVAGVYRTPMFTDLSNLTQLYVGRKLLVTSSMKQWSISFRTAHLVLIAWAKNKMVMNSILKKVVSKIEFKISVE